MKKKIAIAMIFGVLACGSPSEDEKSKQGQSDATPQDDDVKLSRHYSVEYNEENALLTLMAEFRSGNPGDPVMLSEPSSIEVEDQSMSLDSGNRYLFSEKTFKPKSFYTFTWAQNDSKIAHDDVHLAQALSVDEPASGAIHSKKDELIVTHDGYSNKKNESLIFEISLLLLGRNIHVRKEIADGNAAVFSRSDLAIFPNGPVSVRVIRNYQVASKGYFSGGEASMNSKYIAKSVEIRLID